MRMTLSHRYLSVNLDILQGFGFPRSEALKALDMSEDEVLDGSRRLDIGPFLDLLNLAAIKLSDSNIALRMGHKFRVSTFAKTGAIYSFCKDLRDVIQMNGRYQMLAIDAGAIGYVRGEAGEHYMSFTPYFSNAEKYRPITDIVMAAYCTAYRWLSWGSAEDLMAVELAYARPDDQSGYDTIYHPETIFDAPQTRLRFSKIAMEQTLLTYDPVKRLQMKLKLDQMLGQPLSAGQFKLDVDAAISSAIRDGAVNSEVVAKRLGLTHSAFRTALKPTGLGFRQCVDDVRQTLFLKYHGAGLRFSQIAALLAYNDQSAMNHAFRRWYGQSPSEWASTLSEGKIS